MNVSVWNAEHIGEQPMYQHSPIHKPRVVLLEPLSNQLDASSLLRRGEVVTMFGSTGSVHQTPSVHRTEEFVRAVRRWCVENKYNPKYDLFVIAGRATKVTATALAIARQYPDQQMRVLIFDGSAGQYVERIL